MQQFRDEIDEKHFPGDYFILYNKIRLFILYYILVGGYNVPSEVYNINYIPPVVVLMSSCVM